MCTGDFYFVAVALLFLFIFVNLNESPDFQVDGENDEWLSMATHGRVGGSVKLREMQRQIRLQYPGLSSTDLAKMLSYRISQSEPHDRMWYRIQATRQLSSGTPKPEFWDATASFKTASAVDTSASSMSLPGVTTKSKVIEFSSRVYAVNPGENRVRVTVSVENKFA